MDVNVLKKAIVSLTKTGQAELITGMSGDDSESGVKFFG